MSLDNMKVFDEYIMPATIETLQQRIDVFNGATAGAIRLTAEGFDGDFVQASFFASLAASRRRVDRYAAQASVTATDLQELQANGVKVAGGFGPIRYEPSQMTWLQRPTVQGVERASSQLAGLIIQDQLNTAVASAVAAIENNTAVTNDVSGSTGVTYGAINGAHAKFGDMSSNIVANIMDGATAHELVGQNLSNAERLFSSEGVTVIDILNKAVVITDAPALFESGTPDKRKVLGLVEEGVTIYDPSDVITNIDTNNGQTRIETTFQADYSFGVAVKGYAWDPANGGKSPTDVELATGSNWDKVATYDKATAGVIAVGQA